MMEKTIYNVQTGETTVVPFTPEEEAQFWERRTPLAWDSLRQDRNRLLADSDAYVLPDRWAVYTVEQQSAWATYRQALRDLPQNTTDPFNSVWPAQPE
jgi:hypothetical protein